MAEELVRTVAAASESLHALSLDACALELHQGLSSTALLGDTYLSVIPGGPSELTVACALKILTSVSIGK
jgi:hypothetical protein